MDSEAVSMSQLIQASLQGILLNPPAPHSDFSQVAVAPR